jgi:hypothetical protein
VQGRTVNQQQYLNQMATHDITFGIGPAGTGKTYLAVACAVDALERSDQVVLAGAGCLCGVEGMELHALPVSNSDAQWLESRKYSDIDICGLWRVPPHKIGILDRATWGNIEHQALEWVTDCILPWSRRWEQCLQRDLDFGPDHAVGADPDSVPDPGTGRNDGAWVYHPGNVAISRVF